MSSNGTSSGPPETFFTLLNSASDAALKNQVECLPGECAGRRVVLRDGNVGDPRVGEEDVAAELGGVGLHEVLDGCGDAGDLVANGFDVVNAGPRYSATVDVEGFVDG